MGCCGMPNSSERSSVWNPLGLSSELTGTSKSRGRRRVGARRCGDLPRPQCGKKLSLYDPKEEREWRHLDTMQLPTWVHAKVLRVECHDHGVKHVDTSGAEPGSRFTKLF